MIAVPLEALATEDNYDEAAYLVANPDVARAVRSGEVASGRQHFEIFGRHEGRKLRFPPSILDAVKAAKLARLKPLLREDLPCTITPTCYDYLSPALRQQFNIVDTDNVSSNNYDAHALDLIAAHPDGMVLDCGAGYRQVYYDNVVNLDVVDYATTDVRGVAELLPFVDGSFDAVLSIAVLEHVKDPFRSAREIVRVLRPGGRLMCCVPFLQPLHGYPHHYYNMTSQGLENLFAEELAVEKVVVYESVLPIWSLTWIVRSWADGLQGETRASFLRMTVADLLGAPEQYLRSPFVAELPREKNLELASATVLFAHKPLTAGETPGRATTGVGGGAAPPG